MNLTPFAKIILYHEKLIKRQKILAQILIVIIIFSGYFFKIDGKTIDTTTFILLVGLLFQTIDNLVVSYRIDVNLYGSNAFEARELATFIVKHSSKNNFTDANKPKRIITPEYQHDLADIFAKYPAIADLFPDSEQKFPAGA